MPRKRNPERDQFLQNMLIDAIGGINYWAAITNTVPITSGDGYITGYQSITIREKEDGDRNYTVTVDTIATGLNRLLRHIGPGAGQDLRLANRTNGQEGDYDAGDADMALQCGLFGEVTYG